MGRINQVIRLPIFCLIALQLAFSSSTEAAARDPLLFEYAAKSIDGRHIPVSRPLSERAGLTYNTAIEKGGGILCRLKNSSLGDDQSRYTTTAALATSGWTRTVAPLSDTFMLKYRKVFAKLQLPDINESVNVLWGHTAESKNAKGETVPATKADFNNIYNPLAGFILADYNFSPKAMLEGQPNAPLPDVKQWSDVAFVEWKTQAEARQVGIRNLNYVFQAGIINTDTLNMMRKAAGRGDISKTLAWPGQTFLMTDPAGKAILGTPNGAGIGYLLSSHKAELGDRTIESVFAWATGPMVSFVFKIIPLPPNSASGSSSTLLPTRLVEAFTNHTY